MNFQEASLKFTQKLNPKSGIAICAHQIGDELTPPGTPKTAEERLVCFKQFSRDVDQIYASEHRIHTEFTESERREIAITLLEYGHDVATVSDIYKKNITFLRLLWDLPKGYWLRLKRWMKLGGLKPIQLLIKLFKSETI